MRLGLSLALCAGIALLGDVHSALAEEPRRGGVLRVGTIGEPANYDCHGSVSIVTLPYLAPHYSTLLKYDQDNYPDIVGDLAQSWDVSEDNQLFTFRLRDGVKFHDGTPFSAQDIKATFDRIANPPDGVVSARQSAFDSLEEIVVVDPLTVEFRLSAPSSSFLSTLADPWHCVYSAEKLAEDPRFPENNIVGTGPFVFVEHQPGSLWRGERNDNYFNEGQPYLDGFENVSMAPPAIVNALAAGNIHANLRLMSVADTERVASVRGDDVVFQSIPSTSVSILTINVNQPPFDDVRVRRALSLAIDRHLGVEVLGDIAGQRWPHIVFRHGHDHAPSMSELVKQPGFSEDIAASREEARRLLAEAGQESLSFTLLNRNLPIPYERLGIFLIDQWREIGVEVDMTGVETGPWTGRLSGGDYQVGVTLNAPASDDPTEVLLKYVPGTTAEYSGIEDERLVELYRLQDSTSDPEERRRYVDEFVERVMELQYIIPTFNGERIVGHDRRLKGWTVPPSFFVGLDLGNVWLEE